MNICNPQQRLKQQRHSLEKYLQMDESRETTDNVKFTFYRVFS